MADNTDYEDVLEGTVEDAKNAIRDMEDPDYEDLLEAEVEGKNRKTLREWLEKELEDVEYEEGKEEGREEAIQEMFLSSLSPTSALAGGLVVGLIIGLVAASFTPLTQGGQDRVAPSQVQNDVKQLITAGGFNGTAEVSEPVTRHGLYYVNVTLTQDGQNGTVTNSQDAYVTFDGALLMPIQRNPLTGQLMNPVPLQQRIAQSQNPANSSGQ